MKSLLKLAEMMPFLPTEMKDSIHHIAKSAGKDTDSLEMHRFGWSEKAKVNALDPKSRRALKYVSARTRDRDNEIVIPKAINLDEFKKYAHVLVNHNYNLLPIGSDVSIEADDWGIKALTEYADTGEGTVANVVWHLVSQGHMKASSIGFVPVEFTEPGATDWDTVTNKLQSEWQEFDKDKASKHLRRIITGGVLLEHSDVSVPCNTDAELISVVKSLSLDDKTIKHLGWEKVGRIIVPATVHTDKGMGELSAFDLMDRLRVLISDKEGSDSNGFAPYVQDIYEGWFVYTKENTSMRQGYSVSGTEVSLVGEPQKVERRVTYQLLSDDKDKVTPFKLFDGMLEGKALPCKADGAYFESMKPYPGEHAARQNDPGKYERFARQNDKFGDGIHAIFGITEDGDTEVQAIRFDKDKFTPEEAKEWLKKHDYETNLEEASGSKKPEKSITVIQHARHVKVLYAPPTDEKLVQMSEMALAKAMARATGKLM